MVWLVIVACSLMSTFMGWRLGCDRSFIVGAGVIGLMGPVVPIILTMVLLMDRRAPRGPKVNVRPGAPRE